MEINNNTTRSRFEKCMNFKQAIRWDGLWTKDTTHQFDCQKCYGWWVDQVMIEAFKKNQENHNKRTNI